jgi:small nuclear ribonucleoprotein (snRNP)-like protein
MAAMTLPAAVRDALLYKVVTVEMIGGLACTGRVVAFDAENMNLQLDSISGQCLRHAATGTELQPNPPQLQASQGVTVRGASIHSIDVVMPVVVDAVAKAAVAAKASA